MATLKILLRSPLQENPIFSLFVRLFVLSVGLTTFLCPPRSCTEEPAVLGKRSELPLWTTLLSVRKHEFLVLLTPGEMPAYAR